MNLTIFIPMLFVLQLFYWFIGRRAAIKLTTHEDYFLAGKSVPFFPLMMTFLATQVGGGLVLGAAEEAYKYGYWVLLYPMGAALGLILLGSGVGRRLAEFKVATVAQIFEVAFGSVWLKRIASLLSVISLFMILVAQIIASGKFLVSMGFNNTPLFIAFWTIVILYTVQGGLKAVIATDKVQALFFSLVFLVAFGFVFYCHGAVPSLEMSHFANVTPKLTGWLLMPLLFMIIEQDMGQRCFAGASPRVVSKAAFVAGVFTMIICLVPVFLGALAANIGLAIPPGGSVLMTTISQLTGPWMTAIVGCAVLAAIISTATSLINAISSNLLNDFRFGTSSLRIAKGLTAALSIAAIILALYFNNIVDLLIQSYELSVSCLFVPLLFALLKKRGHFTSALLAILFGAMGFFLFHLYPIPFPKEIASLFLSSCGYAIGEMYENCKK